MKKYRILFIFLINFVYSQTPEELKKFMETYGKIKTDQQANEIVKKGVEAEKDIDDGPVRLIVNPGDMIDYYREKMNIIQKDLKYLNKLLLFTDSLPPLEHFGYNYFMLRDSIQFVDNANVSSDYILGYGDEVIISIWGQAEQHEQLILDRDGTVFVKNVGLLYLGGKTIQQAKSYSQKRFGKIYSTLNSNPPSTLLEFSIGKVKNINISVAGHVQFPGNYVINPSISIPNILILAGGVVETGTLRNIKIQRNDQVVGYLDLYPLITGNDIYKTVNIIDGDIIIVPARGKTVAVTGAILSPAYFEIANDNIESLLQYAGGISRLGSDQAIIARYGSQNLYVSKDKFKTTSVLQGDSLIIPKKEMQIKSISVSVDNKPLIKVPWIENISFDTILKIVSVDPNNVKNAELVRFNNLDGSYIPYKFDFKKNIDIKFLAFDHLSIHLNEKFFPEKTVIVKGEINSPGTYPLINNNESLNSILNRSGGLHKSTTINNVVIKRDTLIFGSKTGELILSPGDTIIARPLIGTVKIEGEVHNPGNIAWNESIVAKEYLNFAGGLTSRGDKKHIVYITPYGEASRINLRSNLPILPGSTIRVSERPLAELNSQANRFQQAGSLLTSLVTLAILVNSTK